MTFPKKPAPRFLASDDEKHQEAQNFVTAETAKIDLAWAMQGHTCDKRVRAASTCEGCAKALTAARKAAAKGVSLRPNKVTEYDYKSELRAYLAAFYGEGAWQVARDLERLVAA